MYFGFMNVNYFAVYTKCEIRDSNDREFLVFVCFASKHACHALIYVGAGAGAGVATNVDYSSRTMK